MKPYSDDYLWRVQDRRDPQPEPPGSALLRAALDGVRRLRRGLADRRRER